LLLIKIMRINIMAAPRFDSNEEKRKARIENYLQDAPAAPSLYRQVSSIWQQAAGTQTPKWADATPKQTTEDAKPISPQGPGAW
jgi:hypothetical protein